MKRVSAQAQSGARHDASVRGPGSETTSRFKFGKNWRAFLTVLDDARIDEAERSLREMLRVPDLQGRSFLDVGSGSGLFSLAARRLGAQVHSFDYDRASVECTRELRRRYFSNERQWVVEQGSILDTAYLTTLGTFDVVYSWGVLHHTGAMWQALDNIWRVVSPGGMLYISIYNDQGRRSRYWTVVKRTYNRLPEATRFLVLAPAFILLWGPTFLRDTLLGDPLRSWRCYGGVRGMHPWRDLVDWVGGYPFEVATPDKIFEFFRATGFNLVTLKTVGGSLGCNEFVFERVAGAGKLSGLTRQ
ncbi:MAG: class I SAM-dependent methyltransferase [Gammaproteobacteria bacterium]